MNVRIICIGKLKEKYFIEACNEYAKRLNSFCRFSIVELPEYRLPTNPSDAEIALCVEKEGEKILTQIAPSAFVLALCIEGEIISSEQLAKTLSTAALNGKSDIDLIIGGSYGLSPAVKKRADKRISAGKMTFPHQLFRVMLCEQLYRAFSINNNSKYHK